MIAALLAATLGAAPILYLEGDSAVFSGTTLTSWPAAVGNTGSPTCNPPSKGDLANNHRGVHFNAQYTGDQVTFGSVQSTVSNYTVQVVITSDDIHGGAPAGNSRAYLLRSYIVQDSTDIIFAPISDRTNYYFTGYFDGTAGGDSDFGVDSGWHHLAATSWRGNTSAVTAAARLRVETWVVSSTSGASFYRDGVLRGANTHYTQQKMTDLTMGSTKAGSCTVGLADVTGFDGNVFQVKVWNSALTSAEVLAEQYSAMRRFGVATWPPPGTVNPSSIFGSALVGWYDLTDPQYAEYNTSTIISSIADRTNATTDFTSSVGNPVFEPEGLNGRPAVKVQSVDGNYLLRDDSTATAVYPSGAAAGAVTIFAVGRRCTETGYGMTDGTIAGFGKSNSANPWFDLSMYSPPHPNGTHNIRSFQGSDAGAVRTKQSTTFPGSAPHLMVAESSESTDVATVAMDGTTESGSTNDLGTTSLNTFCIGRRCSNGGYTGNGATCIHLASVGVVNRLVTAGEITSLYTWARVVWGAQ